MKFFVWARPMDWVFSVVPVYRKDGKLYLGKEAKDRDKKRKASDSCSLIICRPFIVWRNHMKYFEIQDSPELKYAPQLKDWYGKFDVRDICPMGFPKLPERELFLIEPSENTIFTDIILFPFLLISPMVREVIQMYREACFYREIY